MFQATKRKVDEKKLHSLPVTFVWGIIKSAICNFTTAAITSVSSRFLQVFQEKNTAIHK